MYRVRWMYDGGSFEQADGLNWVESGGVGSFRFVETGRGDAWVQLLDQSRNVSVRLWNDHMDLLFPPNPNWQENFKKGHWA